MFLVFFSSSLSASTSSPALAESGEMRCSRFFFFSLPVFFFFSFAALDSYTGHAARRLPLQPLSHMTTAALVFLVLLETSAAAYAVYVRMLCTCVCVCVFACFCSFYLLFVRFLTAHCFPCCVRPALLFVGVLLMSSVTFTLLSRCERSPSRVLLICRPWSFPPKPSWEKLLLSCF